MTTGEGLRMTSAGLFYLKALPRFNRSVQADLIPPFVKHPLAFLDDLQEIQLDQGVADGHSL
jgi:hypothetical protein